MSTGSTPHTVTDLARDALAFVDSLGLEEIDLFGFSIGGCVAQEVVMLRPYLVRRLVLAGTGPRGGRGYHPWSRGGPGDGQPGRSRQPPHPLPVLHDQREQSGKGKEFVERIFPRQEARDITPTLAARDAQGEALLEWAVPDAGKLARLAAITQPTLVANGDSDRMIPTPNSYLLAGHIRDARLVIYPDAGHGFLFQFPHEFAAEVNRFLSTRV